MTDWLHNKKWGFHGGSPALVKYTIWKNKGLWSLGPGLYITQDYDKVINYRKGSRTLWLVKLHPEAKSSLDVKIGKEEWRLLKDRFRILKNVKYWEDMNVEAIIAQLMNSRKTFPSSYAARMLWFLRATRAQYTGRFSREVAVFTDLVTLQRIRPNEKFWTDDWMAENNIKKET